MLSNNRLAKLLPVATILITGAIGLIFNSILSVSVQSADTATTNRNNLEIVSNNLVNFRRLEKALDSLETHRSSSNVRHAQHLYQLLQNDLRVAAANGQPAGTQDQTHLQDLFADAAAELTPVKKQLLAISAEIARGDAATFAGRIGNIRAKIDTVTRRLVENGNMPFPSQKGNEASQYAGTAIILAFLALSILLAGMVRKGKFGRFRFDLAQRIEEIDGVIKTDSLTGLPGREAFLEFVNDAFYSKTPNSDFGLIILKVVGLKSINFEFGYSFGDELIVRLGKELADYVERLDSRNCISRTGSAEFSFVIYDVEDDVELSILGHMLLAIVNTPHSRDGFFATLNGCVGVAGMDSDLLSARELILRADLAMQEARKQGANEAATYKRPLRTNQIRKRKIEDDLQSAIEAKQIYPVYQPQFDMVSGKMVGMEALARWDHPELGAIPPLEFIEAAERVGCIVPIGQHILRAACEDASKMRGHALCFSKRFRAADCSR